MSSISILSTSQIYTGSFLCNSQNAVDSAVQILTDGGYDELSGTLWIGSGEFDPPAEVIDLSGFSVLTRVGLLIIQNTAGLTTLNGLHNLDSIPNGTFWIRKNMDLISTAGIAGASFPNIGNSIDANLRITENPSLQNLDGLEGITSIGGQLRIMDNPELVDLSGLENLESIGDLFSLSDFDGDNLNGLGQLKGPFKMFLSDCPLLNDLSDLHSLDSLTSLSISDCASLQDLSPLAGLTMSDYNLSGCCNSADLWISNCPGIQQIPAFNFPANQAGWIDLIDLENLSDLSNLQNLSSLKWLTIEQCPSLTALNMPIWNGGRLDLVDNALLQSIHIPSFAVPEHNTPIAFEIKNNPSLIEIIGNDEMIYANQIKIWQNENLSKVIGFNGFQEILSFSLWQNTKLKTLQGFKNVTQVGAKNGFGGILFIGANDLLENISAFDNIENLYGDLFITGNKITSLPTFEFLTKVSGDISILQTQELVSYSGFHALDSLGSSINIGLHEKLEFLSIASSIDSMNTFSGQFSIFLDNNPSLIRFEGLDTLIFTTKGIRISNCSALEKAPALCNVFENLGAWPIMDLVDNNLVFNSTTSIEEHCDSISSTTHSSPNIDINYYPNPTFDLLYIDAPNSIFSFELIDLFGNNILSGPLGRHTQVNLSPIPSSMYTLLIRDEDGELVKVMKVQKVR